MTLAFAVFVTPIALATETASHRYKAIEVEYDDYLERNFDGSNNLISPFSQIYLTSKTNNEIYTLKDMLWDPDKLDFVKVKKKEVSSLFNEKYGRWYPGRK